MKTLWLNFPLILAILFNLLITVFSQLNTNVVLLGKNFESESYFYDLSYLNSNFNNIDSLQNKYSNRERSGSYPNKHSCNKIEHIPTKIRRDMKLSYFYQKYTEAYGIPVISSNQVTSNGLKRACYVLRFFLSGSNQLKEIFYKRNLRIVVLGSGESVLNVPEYDGLPSGFNLKALSSTIQIPVIATSEENLLCSAGDKLREEDTLLHQLSYALISLNGIDSTLKMRLFDLYDKAKRASAKWSTKFGLIDPKEYLASAIDIYFNSLGKKSQSLDDLKKYDSSLVGLIKQIFRCENTYLSKCQSTRDAEMLQTLKYGTQCETENQIVLPSTLSTTKTTTITSSSSSSSSSSTVTTQKLSTTRSTQKPTTETQSTTSRKTPVTSLLSRETPKQTQSTFLKTINRISTTGRQETQSVCRDINKNCVSWAYKGECTRNSQFMGIECKQSCNMCDESKKIERVTTRKISEIQSIDLSVFENLCRDEFAHCPVFALRGDCKTNPHHMLDKCKRSCNLCGDLVQQKDRIQPTSKNYRSRRPSTIFSTNTPWNRFSYSDANSNFNKFIGYDQTDQTSKDEPSDNSYSVSVNAWKSTTIEAKEINIPDEKTVACKDLVEHCKELAERGDCVSNEATMRYYCPKSCRFC